MMIFRKMVMGFVAKWQDMGREIRIKHANHILMAAAFSSSLSDLRLAVSMGCDVSIEDSKGRSALDLASESHEAKKSDRSLECLEFLRKSGCRPGSGVPIPAKKTMARAFP